MGRFAVAGAVAGVVALLALGAGAGAVSADPHAAAGGPPARSPLELVLDHGRVRKLTALAAAASASTPVAAVAPQAGAAAKAGLSFPQALAALAARHELSGALAAGDRAAWIAARVSFKRLIGTRRSELGAVLATLTAVAHAGELTPSRVPELMLTLSSNR
ncbi:MAG: hypothetical protein ABSB73_06265, partial [Solirubrobacteraceae bacterium]